MVPDRRLMYPMTEEVTGYVGTAQWGGSGRVLIPIYVVCPKSSCSAVPWNCAPRIRTWGSNCQRSYLYVLGGFEASERSCASRATAIVGGKAMDSPPRQCHRALCINRAWVFGAQFHHRARTSPLLAGFSPLLFFLVPQMQIGAAGAALGGVTATKVKWHRCWRAEEKRNSKGASSNGNGGGTVYCV